MDTGTVTLILVVAIVVSLLKPFLELRMKPASALHDTAIRLLAIVVGIVAAVTDYLVHTANWQNGVLLESTLGRGLAAGVGAVLTYHLLTSSVWDVLTPGQTTVTTTTPADVLTGQPARDTVTTTQAAPVLVPAKVEKVEVVTPVDAPPMPTPPPLADPAPTPPTP